jgi:tRNA U38,U39,U40 pseudouridine synthase TruA
MAPIKVNNPQQEVICEVCGSKYPSKNELFRHLGSKTSCLTQEQHRAFLKMVGARKTEKIIVLYGYIPSDYYLKYGITHGSKLIGDNGEPKKGLRDGNHASQLVLEAIHHVAYDGDVSESMKDEKCNRSFGNSARANDHVAQEEFSGALTEVLMTNVPPLIVVKDSDKDDDSMEKEAVEHWIDEVNIVLNEKMVDISRETCISYPGKIVVFGRLKAPKQFNAERDVAHVRIDYLLPAELLYGKNRIKELCNIDISLEEFLKQLPTFEPAGAVSYHNGQNLWINSYLFQLKKLMQRFSTPVVELDVNDDDAVLSKEFNRRKRFNSGKGSKTNSISNAKNQRSDKNNDSILSNLKNTRERASDTKEKERFLQRKRYHNFTPTVMAHEFLSNRRVDRFYHRATVRLEHVTDRPFAVLSIKGDLFLHGQIRCMIGLFVAIVKGYISEDILDAVFDEDVVDLIPMPPAPLTGLFAAEANYMNWEGKMQAVLLPRKLEQYKNGWGTQNVIDAVEALRKEMYNKVAETWYNCGDPPNSENYLPIVSDWLDTILKPWAKTAIHQLESYREWKHIHDSVDTRNGDLTAITERLVPPLSSVSPDVPALYAKVLKLLREASASGNWPSTTPKRQLVMVSTAEGENGEQGRSTSLSMAHFRAKSNAHEPISAYQWKEGQGGASGSFSVGAMPGNQCEQPKANSLFPELMRAAFELEIALYPHRQPSSTIAINRNAQFRPHLDNGAGAGQSTSLIVALGHFSGGELMVEGEKHDIRYKPCEFNGWKQRHWVRPFKGERYSLVWFTPKGCDGIRGIDLCT